MKPLILTAALALAAFGQQTGVSDPAMASGGCNSFGTSCWTGSMHPESALTATPKITITNTVPYTVPASGLPPLISLAEGGAIVVRNGAIQPQIIPGQLDSFGNPITYGYELNASGTITKWVPALRPGDSIVVFSFRVSQ